MQPRQTPPVVSRKGFLGILIRRCVSGALIAAAGILLVLIGAGVFLTYRIVTAHDSAENVTPTSYLLSSYENVNFTDANGGKHSGWLLIGLRGAPVIILCHGYDSNRSALLSLGTVLQANHYNVYLFNFDGPRSKSYFPNLGVHEAAVLQAAVARVLTLPDVDPYHLGLYGNSLGGYAALVASEREPAVEALAVDGIYSHPEQIFDVQLDQLLGGTEPFFRFVSQMGFRLFTLGTTFPDVRSGLSSLSGKPKLFLASDDAPTLESATRRLYESAPQPKRLVVLPHTETAPISGSERKEYEDQVLNFFLRNLPLRSD
jgi:uncharacterized protein